MLEKIAGRFHFQAALTGSEKNVRGLADAVAGRPVTWSALGRVHPSQLPSTRAWEPPARPSSITAVAGGALRQAANEACTDGDFYATLGP